MVVNGHLSVANFGNPHIDYLFLFLFSFLTTQIPGGRGLKPPQVPLSNIVSLMLLCLLDTTYILTGRALKPKTEKSGKLKYHHLEKFLVGRLKVPSLIWSVRWIQISEYGLIHVQQTSLVSIVVLFNRQMTDEFWFFQLSLDKIKGNHVLKFYWLIFCVATCPFFFLKLCKMLIFRCPCWINPVSNHGWIVAEQMLEWQ